MIKISASDISPMPDLNTHLALVQASLAVGEGVKLRSAPVGRYREKGFVFTGSLNMG